MTPRETGHTKSSDENLPRMLSCAAFFLPAVLVLAWSGAHARGGSLLSEIWGVVAKFDARRAVEERTFPAV
jgi:hypothetical protein